MNKSINLIIIKKVLLAPNVWKVVHTFEHIYKYFKGHSHKCCCDLWAMINTDCANCPCSLKKCTGAFIGFHTLLNRAKNIWSHRITIACSVRMKISLIKELSTHTQTLERIHGLHTRPLANRSTLSVVFLQRHNSHSSSHCAHLEEEEEAEITEACKDTGRIDLPLPLSLSALLYWFLICLLLSAKLLHNHSKQLLGKVNN